MAKELDRDVLLKANLFRARLEQIKDAFVGRDQAVDLVALAALCREHVLLIGPPGTAKTRLLDQFRQMLDAKYFSYLLTRFTEPAELFGPIDFSLFQSQGVYKVNVTDMLPEAEIAFLDEIFQGSSAILNSLLTIINERVYNNGSEVKSVPLVTLLGASNEIPDDPLLRAFSDRFLLRLRLDYVPVDSIVEVLQVGWRTEQALIRSANGSGGAGDDDGLLMFPLDDLKLLQQQVAEVDVEGVRAEFADILRELREDGVAFSDRRAVKAQKAFAAAALLQSRRQAQESDLWPLVHIWTDPRDEPTIRRIVEGHGIPVDHTARGIVRDPHEIEFSLRELVGAKEQLSSMEDCAELHRRLAGLLLELRRDHAGERQLLRQVQDEQRDVFLRCQERFGSEGVVADV